MSRTRQNLARVGVGAIAAAVIWLAANHGVSGQPMSATAACDPVLPRPDGTAVAGREPPSLQREAVVNGPMATGDTPAGDVRSSPPPAVLVRDAMGRAVADIEVVLVSGDANEPQQLAVATSRAQDGLALFPDCRIPSGCRAVATVPAGTIAAAVIAADLPMPVVLTLPDTGRVTIRLSAAVARLAGFINVGAVDCPAVLVRQLTGEQMMAFAHVGVGLDLVVRVLCDTVMFEARVAGPMHSGDHVVVEIDEDDGLQAAEQPVPQGLFQVEVIDPNGRPAIGIVVEARGMESGVCSALVSGANGVVEVSRHALDEPVELRVTTAEWRATPTTRTVRGAQSARIELERGGRVVGRAEPVELAGRTDLEWLLCRLEAGQSPPESPSAMWLRQTPEPDGSFAFPGLAPGVYALQLVARGERSPVLLPTWLQIGAEPDRREVVLGPIRIGHLLQAVACELQSRAGLQLAAVTARCLDDRGISGDPVEFQKRCELLVGQQRTRIAFTARGCLPQVHAIGCLPRTLTLAPAWCLELRLADGLGQPLALRPRRTGPFDPIRFGEVETDLVGSRCIAQIPGPGTYQLKIGSRVGVVVVSSNHESHAVATAGAGLEVSRCP